MKRNDSRSNEAQENQNIQCGRSRQCMQSNGLGGMMSKKAVVMEIAVFVGLFGTMWPSQVHAEQLTCHTKNMHSLRKLATKMKCGGAVLTPTETNCWAKRKNFSSELP